MSAALENYTYVCNLGDLPTRGKKILRMNGRTVLIIAYDTGVCAVEATDDRLARQLARGEVLEGALTVQGTGAKYDLETGQCIEAGAWPFGREGLRVIDTRIVDGKVYLRL